MSTQSRKQRPDRRAGIFLKLWLQQDDAPPAFDWLPGCRSTIARRLVVAVMRPAARTDSVCGTKSRKETFVFGPVEIESANRDAARPRGRG